MNLSVQIANNQLAKPPFGHHRLLIQHFLLLYGQTFRDPLDRQAIARDKSPPQRRIPREHLDLNSRREYAAKLSCVSIVDVVEVYTTSTLGPLRICGRPLACCFEVELGGLFTILL